MIINYNDAYEYCAKVINERELFYPLDVWELVESYGLKTVSYTKFAEKYNCEFSDLTDISIYGFLLRDKNSCNAIIYYNDRQSVPTQRFTLLHELGHYVMDHYIDNKENDRLVDCFARNLIAPVSICKKLELKHSFQISEYFNISPSAGVTRANLLELDYLHIKKLSIHPTIHYKSITYATS